MSPYASALARGDELARQGRWAEAEVAYQQAANQRPQDEQARTRLRVARWNHAREVALQAQRQLATGNLKNGLHLASQALQIDAAVPEVQQTFEDASKRALDEVDRLAKARQERDALAWVILVRQEIPKDPRGARLETELRERVAALEYAQGDEYFRRKLPGNAILSFLHADRIRLGYRDARSRAEALREQLSQELRFHLAVIQASDASPLTVELTHALQRWPADPNRPMLTLDRESSPSAHGVQVEPFLGEVRRSHEQRAESRSCTYVCGVDRRPNPAHEAIKHRVAEAERKNRLADDEVIRTHQARSDAQRARDAASAADRVAESSETQAKRELSTCRQRATTKSKNPCDREEKRVHRAQRERERTAAEYETSKTSLGRAEGEVRNAEEQARKAKRTWEEEVATLGRTPLILEEERRCSHAFGVEIHEQLAQVTRELRTRPVGSSRIPQPPPSELSERARDETFAPQQDRCTSLVAGDPLSLPSEREMDLRLLKKAEADARKLILGWYDTYAQELHDDELRAGQGGRFEERTEARVRHRLLTGKAIEEG